MSDRQTLLEKALRLTTEKHTEKRLGLAQSTISMMRSGKRRVSDKTLVIIAKQHPELADEAQRLLGLHRQE